MFVALNLIQFILDKRENEMVFVHLSVDDINSGRNAMDDDHSPYQYLAKQ